MWKMLAMGGVSLLTVMSSVMADTITVKGTTYKDVYVRESDSRYYIQFPKEGRAISVGKSDVNPGDVLLSKDTDVRDALLKEWEANYARLHPPKKQKEASQKPVSQNTSTDTVSPIHQKLPPAIRPRHSFDYNKTKGHPQKTVQPEDIHARSYIDHEKGIRERSSVNVDGVPKLVLRGTNKKDPNREQRVLEFALAERARAEEEQARREQEEQAYWDSLPPEYTEFDYPGAEEFYGPEQTGPVFEDIPGPVRIPEFYPAEPDVPIYEYDFAPQPWQEPDIAPDADPLESTPANPSNSGNEPGNNSGNPSGNR
ncbi:MAG TPA: hypothetical protein PLI09_26940 [Candidatus Hydrogenedentes bacterium]|nr:hypothetical protein [Candidatus Hydrogenedentota bacterium]